MFKIKQFILAMALSPVLLLTAAVIPVSARDATERIQDGLCAGANLDIDENTAGACTRDNDDALEKLNNIVRRIVNILSIIVGVVAVIMIIVGGFRYVTSGGSDASVTGAKNTILYAVIGLIIVALAQVIVNFVLRNLANS